MSTSALPPEDEHLTTGWEPELAVDDSLVRQAVYAYASWAATVARLTRRPHVFGPRWAGGYSGDRGWATNRIVLLQPGMDHRELLAQVEQMLPPGAPYLLIDPWPSPDLRSHGLGLVGHPPLMVRLPQPLESGLATELDVRPVEDADELAAAERVLVDGYPMPELQPVSAGEVFPPQLVDDAATRLWLAWDGDEPVAVSLAHVAAGAVLVECVATLPRARRRGAGSAVMWAATLADTSCPAVLLASDEGRPVYERMDYVAIERWTVWARPAWPAAR